MNIWEDFLKKFNNKETADIIKNNKYTFDANGKIGSTNQNEYDIYTGKLKDPYKLYDAYKKRDDTIGNIQLSLNNLGVTDSENNPLKVDKVFGPKTQSAWDKFVYTIPNEQENNLKDIAPQKILSSIAAGTVPSLNYINPLQPKITNVGKRIIEKPIKETNEKFYKYQLYDKNSRQRLLEFDIHNLPDEKGTSIENVPHINVQTSKNATDLQKSVAKSLNHKPIPKQFYDTFQNFDDVVKKAKTGGKAMAALGIALDAYDIGTTIYADKTDEDGKIGKKTYSAVAGAGGSWVGGAAGAKAGAALFAGIGTFICPGPGTVIGGFLGGVGGGIAGALGGRKLSEFIVDKNYKGD